MLLAESSFLNCSHSLLQGFVLAFVFTSAALDGHIGRKEAKNLSTISLFTGLLFHSLEYHLRSTFISGNLLVANVITSLIMMIYFSYRMIQESKDAK